MNTESPAGPEPARLSTRSERNAGRERREAGFRKALEAYSAGSITLTEARIEAGLASRRERLAYSFPRLFGSLCRLSAYDRLRPAYYARSELEAPGSRPRAIEVHATGGLRLLPRAPRAVRRNQDSSQA
jgi:hypothetical protein